MRFFIVQEAWGEDMLLTSHLGVAIASGMSKNSSWDRPDAVAPVSNPLPKQMRLTCLQIFHR